MIRELFLSEITGRFFALHTDAYLSVFVFVYKTFPPPPGLPLTVLQSPPPSTPPTPSFMFEVS